MNTVKQIKKLRRKNCTIRVSENKSDLGKAFWGEVRDREGNTLHQTSYQYTADDALALAKEHAI